MPSQLLQVDSKLKPLVKKFIWAFNITAFMMRGV